ncbi:terminase small subunit [Buttiauxella sp. 3AFRM03]|uniref:terminase small subunit n=1 Tax=Buttiauxella sp. 3AFRM03 TaxID=2479367 RepID=UPI001EE3C663|nr:terminase small subunit [Buttiauxella sp. 3AFRM03]
MQEARIRLTEAQALAQELKNLRDERGVVDTAFCSFALSRLENDIASILDSIPLSMQRRFVDIGKAQLEFLKKLIAKATNNATTTSGKIPEMLDEYIDSAS